MNKEAQIDKESEGKKLVRDKLRPVSDEDLEELPPNERWQVRKGSVHKMLVFGKVATNISYWYAGELYHELNESPSMYFDDVEKAPNTTRQLGKELGVSHDTISRAFQLYKCYDREQIWKFADLPQEALYQGINLPPSRRDELFEELLKGFKEDKLLASEVDAEVLEAVEDEQSTEDASEQKQSEEPSVKRPPISKVRELINELVIQLEDIESECGLEYHLTSDDIDALASFRATLKEGQGIIDDLLKEE